MTVPRFCMICEYGHDGTPEAKMIEDGIGAWVRSHDYDALAAQAEQDARSLAFLNDTVRELRDRLAERALDWLNQQEQIKDQQARLAEAEALLTEMGNDSDDRVSPGYQAAIAAFLAEKQP